MSKATVRKIWMTSGMLAVCLAFASGAQAALYVADCAALNGAGNLDIKILQPNDDVVVPCLLQGASVTIRAHSITVDNTGVNSGGIDTTGTPGMKLYAGLNDKATACTDPTPATATITIKGATLTDENGNGGEDLKSCGNIDMQPGSNLNSAGAQIFATCLWPSTPPSPFVSPYGCTISASTSQFFGNRVIFKSQGDMTLFNDTFQTIGPRDQQTFISYFGNLFAGGGCSGTQQLPPGTCVATAEDACSLCQLCHGKNSFSGGVESNFFAFAEQFVDFSGVCINIAENITITADGRSPVAPYAVLPEPPTGAINLTSAEIRDDFGKTGYISITATPPLRNGLPWAPDDVPSNPGNAPDITGTGTILYDLAILVDDGKNGGGTDPQAVAFMNGFRAFQAGDCVGVTPTCTTRAIPARGFVADPVGRVNTNVQGIPKCDS